MLGPFRRVLAIARVRLVRQPEQHGVRLFALFPIEDEDVGVTHFPALLVGGVIGVDNVRETAIRLVHHALVHLVFVVRSALIPAVVADGVIAVSAFFDVRVPAARAGKHGQRVAAVMRERPFGNGDVARLDEGILVAALGAGVSHLNAVRAVFGAAH